MRVAVTVALSKRIGQVLTPALAGDIAREVCATRDESIDPARVPTETHDDVTFQIERLRDAFEPLQGQRLAYLAEREPGRRLSIDWDRLLELSRLGRLVIFTARDAQQILIGSMWVWIGPSIDTGYVALTDDMLYVEPARRGGWCTVKLWQYGERAAFTLGVREATIHMRHGNRVERLARFNGYKPDSLRVKKSHYGDSFADAPTRHGDSK